MLGAGFNKLMPLLQALRGNVDTRSAEGTLGRLKLEAPQYGDIEASHLPASASILASPETAVSGYGPSEVGQGGSSIIDSLIAQEGDLAPMVSNPSPMSEMASMPSAPLAPTGMPVTPSERGGDRAQGGGSQGGGPGGGGNATKEAREVKATIGERPGMRTS